MPTVVGLRVGTLACVYELASFDLLDVGSILSCSIIAESAVVSDSQSELHAQT